MRVVSSQARRRALLPSLAFVAALTGCDSTPSGPASEPTPVSESSPESNWVPAGAPVRSTWLRIGQSTTPRELRYSDVDGLAVFQGDIILGRAAELPARPGDVSAQGVSITGTGYRWPMALVPYTIDSGLSDQARVTSAIRHWEERTNVRFVPRDANNAGTFPNYVTFRTGDGCSSHVGMQGGQQFVNLASNCSAGTTIHEIGHALGMWHEQSREDRNRFVVIHWENIKEGEAHNFVQHYSDGDDLGGYDYGSIMHYRATEFSANGRATIEVLTPGVTIGQRNGLSANDINSAYVLYPDPPTARNNSLFTMDYDGDGDDDLVVRGPGGQFVGYRADQGSFAYAGPLISTDLSDRWGWGEGHRFFVADYDGDEDDDLIVRNAAGEFIALRSDRTSFFRTVPIYRDAGMSDANGWNFGNRYFVMDYDGDRDDDLVGRRPDGAFVAIRSVGTYFVSGGVLATTGMSDAQGWNDGLRFFVADYDGDEDDDLITRDAAGSFRSLRADGGLLTWTGVLYSDFNLADAQGWFDGNRFYVMDYDGDEDDDLVLRFGSGDFVALRSERTYFTGGGLLTSSLMSDAWNWNSPNRYFVTDSDDDGDDDLIARDTGGYFYSLRSDRTALVVLGPVLSTTIYDP